MLSAFGSDASISETQQPNRVRDSTTRQSIFYTAPRYANDMHECTLEVKSIINSSYLPSSFPFPSLGRRLPSRHEVHVVRRSLPILDSTSDASPLTTHNSSTNSRSQAQGYRQSVTDRVAQAQRCGARGSSTPNVPVARTVVPGIPSPRPVEYIH